MKKSFFLILLSAIFVFANSLSEIKQSKVIRVGVYENEPPFSKSSEKGFEGFEVELANALAGKIFGNSGGRIELIPVTNEVRFPMLQNNQADMIIAAASITEERKGSVDFSMPYFTVNLGILTKKDSNIHKIGDLMGKKIGVIRKTTGEAYIKKDGGYNVSYCNDSVDCYRRLKSGEIDGYCNNNLFVMVYPVVDPAVEVNIKNLGDNVFLGVAVQKGNAELLEAINKGLIALSKEGFFKKAYEDTFESFYKGTVDKKYFLLDDLYSFF